MPGSTADVAARWTERLRAATPVAAAKDLYAGRAFVDAGRAARQAGGRLVIVSAGLGLIDSETQVPAYGLTTVKRETDSVLSKTQGTSSAWWSALQPRSPFQTSAIESETGLILAALPAAYLSMVADDWIAWPAERLARLRLFTKERPGAQALQPAWMPYDDRLDAVEGAHAGTQGDFAQRALRHFVSIGAGRAVEEDRSAVLAALEGLSPRDTPVRRKLSDAEIMSHIAADWHAVGGRSTAMLRRLRDDLDVACEQGRFQTLFKAVAIERTKGGLL